MESYILAVHMRFRDHRNRSFFKSRARRHGPTLKAPIYTFSGKQTAQTGLQSAVCGTVQAINDPTQTELCKLVCAVCLL